VAGALASIGGLVPACGHGAGGPGAAPAAGAAPPGRGAGAEPGSDVKVSLAAGLPEEQGAAWLAYALVHAAGSTEQPRRDGYATEKEARATLAQTWSELRGKGAPADRYLDQLVAVQRAGWMREYVIATFAEPGWIIPADDVAALKLADFQRWAHAHIPDHRAVTLAGVEVAGAAAPPAPGATLPASEAINPAHVPCARTRATVAEALRRWTAEEAALAGKSQAVPLSTASGELLLAALDRAHTDGRFKGRGAALVSPRAVNVVFIAGFCAVEDGQPAAAEPLLRRAAALDPANANIRAELAHVLTAMKRLDDAEHEVDIGLGLATDHCHLGILWRKRGYLLFDRGKLVDAYAAYARSLEFDPGSDIPRKEMSLIVSELRRAGGYDAEALRHFEPHPMGDVRVTKCR
jgi:tetratricopeptide (TPR) repeat protein